MLFKVIFMHLCSHAIYNPSSNKYRGVILGPVIPPIDKKITYVLCPDNYHNSLIKGPNRFEWVQTGLLVRKKSFFPRFIFLYLFLYGKIIIKYNRNK